MRNPPSAAKCLRLAQWPCADRDLWHRATHNRTRSFKGEAPAAKLAPPTLEKVEAGYGRWLGGLRHLGLLLDEAPCDRATLDRLEAFFALMVTNGNRGNTIVARFHELKQALELMYAPRQFHWVMDLGGYPVAHRVNLERRPLPVIDNAAWLDWALELLDVAKDQPPDPARSDLWQDGLIIGLFGMRGMRLRTMAAIEIGRQLREREASFDLVFDPEDIKNKRSLAYPIPDALVDPMRRFLRDERHRLLEPQSHDWLWVGLDGFPLKRARIQTMIRTRSRHRFGISFGPHICRHSLMTSSLRRDPAHAGIPSAILGATDRTLEKHYNLGRQIDALNIHQDTLEREREMLRRSIEGDSKR